MLAVSNVYVYLCRWIRDPHDKIALCFCNQKNWVFFFNSNPKFHAIAQLEVQQNEHPGALTKACYLDLSEVLSLSASEVANARARGAISDDLLDRVTNVLEQQIDTLPEAQRELALGNFVAEKERRLNPE